MSMRTVAKRLGALEGRALAQSGVWHWLLWNLGQSWEDVLAAYGQEIALGDNVVIRHVVGADDVQRTTDPVHTLHASEFEAWRVARAGARSLTVRIAKPSCSVVSRVISVRMPPR